MQNQVFRKIIFIVALLIVGEQAAHADHHLVFVSKIINIDDQNCAVELTIATDNQDAFEAADNVTLNGVELDNLSTLVLGGLNDSGGNNDAGDKILLGSVAFHNSHGNEANIAVDIQYEDAFCNGTTGDFNTTAEICFNIDDDGDDVAETEVDCIDLSASDLSTFGDSTVVYKTSASDTPEIVDLTANTITITNNDGDAVTLGTGELIDDTATGDDDDDDSDGGCALVSGAAPSHTALSIALLSLAALGLTRFAGRKA